jgi:hypothetical protein
MVWIGSEALVLVLVEVMVRMGESGTCTCH